MTEPSNDYDNEPDHPLQGVDKAILEVARVAAREAEADGAVEPEMAEPIADLIIMRLRQAGMLNEKDAGT